MKKCRLDQILLEEGYASEEQIKQALIKQKDSGGRIGSNLLQMKYITEEQLAQALAIQYGPHPPAPPPKPPRKETLSRFPVESVRQHLAIPLETGDDGNSVVVLMADPEDDEALGAVRKAFTVENISPVIAPESLVMRMIDEWYCGVPGSGTSGNIQLPELFGEDQSDDEELNALRSTSDIEEDGLRNVLMVCSAIFLKNFLSPIFEREGCRLLMSSDEAGVISTLEKESIDTVLVSMDMAGDFDTWLKRGRIAAPYPEISFFTSVSGNLLDNPVPYNLTSRAMIKTLQHSAENRCAADETPPPYDLICRDLRALSLELGMNTLAVDGLQMASLLLDAPGKTDLDISLELAASLKLPWDLEGTTRAAAELLSGRRSIDRTDIADREVLLGAELLALVWFRHTSLSDPAAGRNMTQAALKSILRKRSGSLARSEIIETYIRHIEQCDAGSTTYHQIFVVGGVDSVVDRFAARLKSVGYHPVRIYDIEEAKRMSERLSPTAVLIDIDSEDCPVSGSLEIFGAGESILLFAVTSGKEPSIVLDLFDSGFDDVFAPPFDFDIISARIDKAIRVRNTPGSGHSKANGFSASFKAFSFTDLVQALSQSMKSVALDLTRGNGEKAVMHLESGQTIYAKSGEMIGVDAIYHVISWEEDGSFVVEPKEEFDERNVNAPIESILMEGCRMLDESKA